MPVPNADGSNTVTFQTSSAGDWANGTLRMRIDYDTAERPADEADRATYNLTASTSRPAAPSAT